MMLARLSVSQHVLYSYANPDFTKLETKPELLFQHPNGISTIDGDITKVGDKFHLFYAVNHGIKAGPSPPPSTTKPQLTCLL